jgi:hypothetical protein
MCGEGGRLEGVVERDERCGCGGDRERADVLVAGVAGERVQVDTVGQVGDLDPSGWEGVAQIADPALGDLLAERLALDEHALALGEQLVASDQVKQPGLEREPPEELM